MPKNIVIFSDGTGQEGGRGSNTNVYHLFNMIEDRTDRQVAFYDPGLGTGWQKITGNISGLGISRNIQQCYKFLFENYKAGDQIFLIGFSRGAATVRSLSSFIHYFGILPASRPELIAEAYGIYKINDEARRKREADAFVGRHHTMWARVRFLGCFDTVAALGLPSRALSAFLDWLPFFRHRFHNFRLSESVEHARQALAIDDERKTFHPLPWDPEIKPYQTLKQVWFQGMHTDVGGGYKEQETAGIPLVWMAREAMRQGLLIWPKNKVKVEEDPNGTMHDSRKGFPGILFRRERRRWDLDRHGRPLVHESVLKRTRNRMNGDQPPYEAWILSGPYEVEPWEPLKEKPLAPTS